MDLSEFVKNTTKRKLTLTEFMERSAWTYSDSMRKSV